MKRFFLGMLSIYFMMLQVAYGWNSAGHQLIARMALAQLSPDQARRLTMYNDAYHWGFQPRYLAQSAAWLDWVHCSKPSCTSFSKYHYIDIPYSIDGTPVLPPDKMNAVVAIKQARGILEREGDASTKGLQLRILLHVVGDIHQPMHAVSLFSEQFPEGDRGGNAYLLGKNRISKNLHAYWDRGGGFLTRKSLHHHQMKSTMVRLQRKYPCHLNEVNLDPNVWAKESFELAKHEAYQLEFNAKPSRAYQKRVRELTEQRITLAACRLAVLLKQIV